MYRLIGLRILKTNPSGFLTVQVFTFWIHGQVRMVFYQAESIVIYDLIAKLHINSRVM